MFKRRFMLLAAAVCLMPAPLTSAQNGPDRPARNARGPLAGFEDKAPDVGGLVPDITLHDADGKEVRLRSIKGHYTVLVFGCLT